ncbi:unnamed protein product [Paramecium pentaurelia]|uniref:Uncharacterized protein n=1 Tax=Paramecium pentaurelia TaxID=43138 RepID=A0A8S1S7L4_9CILI|nr:unnamed protein product [Paramecium pentaurelia]
MDVLPPKIKSNIVSVPHYSNQNLQQGQVVSHFNSFRSEIFQLILQSQLLIQNQLQKPA